MVRQDAWPSWLESIRRCTAQKSPVALFEVFTGVLEAALEN